MTQRDGRQAGNLHQRLRTLIATGQLNALHVDVLESGTRLGLVRVTLRLSDGRSFAALAAVDAERADVEAAQDRALARLLAWLEGMVPETDAERVAGEKRPNELPGSGDRPTTYRWDAFWRWARSLGLQNREQIRSVLGYEPDWSDPDATKRAIEEALAVHRRSDQPSASP